MYAPKPRRSYMSYTELRAAIEVQLPTLSVLLAQVTDDQYKAFFELAVKDNDYTVIDVLLTWKMAEKKDFSWIDPTRLSSYPIDVLAMLVCYGVNRDVSIGGDNTLFGFIQKQDPQISTFLAVNYGALDPQEKQTALAQAKCISEDMVIFINLVIDSCSVQNLSKVRNILNVLN